MLWRWILIGGFFSYSFRITDKTKLLGAFLFAARHTGALLGPALILQILLTLSLQVNFV